VANAPKIYDFPMEKVEGRLVSYLKKKRGESTVADMIAGTGLPKYQVEQAAKVALDEYAGRLKVTESGELLYYFPEGMRSTVHGLGPSLRRFWKSFVQGSLKTLALLFKIWIVAMLVGYFVGFVALVVLAILASFAASMANRSDNRGGGRDRGGGGFGGMYLVIRLLDLILRMWFWSNLLGTQRRKPQQGRAFYKSVFGFVFGEGDPNKGWEDEERRYIISYIRSHKGVITVEELMALTGREPDEANSLMNRILLEFEGEPGVTDNGTVVYAFPELMRASQSEQKALGQVPLLNPVSKHLSPFSANKRRTNGWILFFNAFNLAFGSYFLVLSLTQSAGTLLEKTGPYLYSFTGRLLQQAGIDSPVPLLAVFLGAVPVAFSILFFLVPLLRKISLDRQNARIREEILRRRILTQMLSSPARVDPSEVRPVGNGLDPGNLPAVSKRIIDRLAASMGAEPLVKEKEGTFAYKFPELERQIADLEDYRRKIDLKSFEVGKTIFDSGK
jgi:hypothetical protein